MKILKVSSINKTKVIFLFLICFSYAQGLGCWKEQGCWWKFRQKKGWFHVRLP